MPSLKDIQYIVDRRVNFIVQDPDGEVKGYMNEPYFSEKEGMWCDDSCGDFKVSLGNIIVDEFKQLDFADRIHVVHPDYKHLLGKLCWGSDISDFSYKSLGILQDIDMDACYPFTMQDATSWKHIQPVLKSEISFLEQEGEDEHGVD